MIEDTGNRTPFIDGVSHVIYKRSDTGEEFASNKIPIGAMWYSDEDYYRKGPDGRSLFVETPGGTWNIDMRASNCGLPNDDVHFCWCRHGVPPDIYVDKACSTCKAGAGSIQMGNFHGYIRKGGYLTDH